MTISPMPGRHVSEHPPLIRKHIMVIDTEVTFLDAVRELFRSENFTVTATEYAPEIYERIAAAPPSLLMIDLRVGEEATGLDLLSRLNEADSTRDIPLILTSTSPALLERVEAERAAGSAHRCLIKPFALDELLAAVEDLIESREPGSRVNNISAAYVKNQGTHLAD